TLAARAIELDWWQVHTVGDLELTVVPARHWSKRTATDTNASLWSGVVFKARGRRVFFAGDTGYSEHFKLIENRTGTIDVALLPIGAYEPRWFMKESHMNPDDAVMAHLDLKPKISIAIHFGTFRLTDEAIEDPIKDLQVALQKYGVNEDLFKVPQNGETFSIL
ncbi:MAG: MBL fold metallo-hydrolase, partial [Bdellovibrionales bacterium]|nr:MBL fold metallo-hydrolase [Oligoflexia bacterium]